MTVNGRASTTILQSAGHNSNRERHETPRRMNKFPKSCAEIERLILDELRATDRCEDAVGVSVVEWLIPRGGVNWTVAAYNPGKASDYECDLALHSIVPRLQGFYNLVQKH